MENDVIVMSFLKIAQKSFVGEYILLIPIDVPSFKLIEGQIKELQGVVPNTPQAENDQKSPGRIGLRKEDNLIIKSQNNLNQSLTILMWIIRIQLRLSKAVISWI